MVNDLNDLVSDLLRQHNGGEVFFDHLDEALRNSSTIMEALIKTLREKTGRIICSGKFGRVFANVAPEPVIVVNGGLRSGEKIDDLSYLDLKGQKFIFVDDSFYLGRTRDRIKDELERQGAHLIHTFVIYDGSKIKDENVTSLYRYHK